MTSAVVVEDLTKWYGPRLAVDRVSFEIPSGTVLGLLGPNGSGKTTILRILTGYLRPSSGRVRVAGVDTIDSPLEARRRIGYVPEDVPLYDWMRVGEFLSFMAQIKGVAAASAPGAVASALERLALAEVVRMPIGKLSRGFRQRVAVAQALLGEPEVLVLDEPTNGLDPRQIIEVRQLIRELAGRHTVLVTSHILSEVEKIADRAAILLRGRLLAVHPLRDADGARRLWLRVRGRVDELRACLVAIPGVANVMSEPAADGTCAATMDVATADAADAVATAVVGGGLALLELTRSTPDLEAVFLALTAGQPEPTA